MLPSRLWSELTTIDIETADMAAAIAILPVAALEQHGPHLPLGTDTFIMEGYLARTLARLPADLPAVVLPVQSIGFSIEHGGFPGTLSLTARTALDAWGGLVDAVARTGCRKLVVISSHGGNSSLVDILAREARVKHGLFLVQAAWQRFGYPDDVFSNAERAHGIHGGQIETALMLAFRPDLVRMDAAANFVAASVALDKANVWLRTFGRPSGFGWMAQDLNASGVVGNAATADAAIGEACADHGAKAFVELLREVQAFDLAGLVTRPAR